MSDKDKKKVKRLKPSEWEEAKALWRTGDVTLRELSTRFGISIATLSNRFKRDQVVKGEQSIAKAARETVERTVNEDAEVIARRIRETREESYTWMRTVARVTVAEVVEAKQKGRAPCKATLQALSAAANVLKTAQESRSKLLGMDREDESADELPELVIRQMSAEEQQALRTAQQAASAMPEDYMDEMDELGGSPELPED